MNTSQRYLLICSLLFLLLGCSDRTETRDDTSITAAEILGNPNYPAISYGGYRGDTRETVPSIEDFQEDLRILSAMGIKIIRTYNTQQYRHTANLLKAISQLKDKDPSFEMYVMLGVWIECQGAWSTSPNHKAENVENNTAEIETAVNMAQTYPDIVKIIAVGNEAMVHWAASYFVFPDVILKWVNYLKEVRSRNEIPSSIWITSSDNYESWGGGAKAYHTEELSALIKAVDYISLHTYPFHDSHYNPAYWGVPEDAEGLPKVKQMEVTMLNAKKYAISQYQGAVDYMTSLGLSKPVHIGETGWATRSNSFYGDTGSKAADEYKEKLYYEHMRDWSNSAGMSCFYFEAFDEQWKDPKSALGSENHFGLINLKGEAKFALWDRVDEGVFKGLIRNGLPITKTYEGDINRLTEAVLAPPLKSEMSLSEVLTVNEVREIGETVKESTYVLVNGALVPNEVNDMTYPSEKLKLNAWEGTCGIEMSQEGIIKVNSGNGEWWGCALETVSGSGEDLSNFKSGRLHFEIKGNTSSSFQVGFQTGSFPQGTQKNNLVTFSPDADYSISKTWQSFSIPIADLNKGANLKEVTSLLFFRGDKDFDGEYIYIKNIFYSKE